MSTVAPVTPFLTAPGEGESLWFLDALASVKASAASTGSAVSITEFRAPRGHGSPLHLHRDEAEWWYVLEGELAVWADGTLVEAAAGAFVFGPPALPHTFEVVSDEARFLLGTAPGGFDRFLRAASVPATAPTLPPAGGALPDPAELAALAAGFGVEILGPPGIPTP
ncbi:quercetin 2,3-dioxygenase [Pseudonocardia oceani]|uniref:Quercetin 2,3-dioxygenase n=4 Tax=Pseudonocardia oceani TaxID=2792013 RepID=A0ABS6U3E8_9PSEU|nr:quercetin 2,3-dioxygenase [Pseudonocardia oceani]MBW0126756.1 quercetin 2,3-dioxygenase [Pseudonocardia oceani]